MISYTIEHMEGDSAVETRELDPHALYGDAYDPCGGENDPNGDSD